MSNEINELDGYALLALHLKPLHSLSFISLDDQDAFEWKTAPVRTA